MLKFCSRIKCGDPLFGKDAPQRLLRILLGSERPAMGVKHQTHFPNMALVIQLNRLDRAFGTSDGTQVCQQTYENGYSASTARLMLVILVALSLHFVKPNHIPPMEGPP